MEAVKEVQVVTQNELNTITSSFDFLLNNQIYIYAVVILIVLIIIGWYLYNKYFNKSVSDKNSKKDESLEKETDKNKDQDKDQYKNKDQDKDTVKGPENSKSNNNVKMESETEENIIDPNKKYYLVDQKGNPILLNDYFNGIVSHKLQQNELEREKVLRVDQQNSKQKQRPKLSHPGEQNDVSLNDLEDENLAALNLTNEEMLELKKQLLQLQKNQKQQVTAQNDEDSDE